jgi:hypothetical protein
VISSVLAHPIADLKDAELKTNVILVGISSVMTWNKTTKVRGALAQACFSSDVVLLLQSSARTLSEAKYRSRKTSAKYKGLRLLETVVMSAQKDNLQACTFFVVILASRPCSSFNGELVIRCRGSWYPVRSRRGRVSRPVQGGSVCCLHLQKPDSVLSWLVLAVVVALREQRPCVSGRRRESDPNAARSRLGFHRTLVN